MPVSENINVWPVKSFDYQRYMLRCVYFRFGGHHLSYSTSANNDLNYFMQPHWLARPIKLMHLAVDIVWIYHVCKLRCVRFRFSGHHLGYSLLLVWQ